MKVYKNYEIEKADYGYYEATNLIDCDAELIHDKTIEGIKTYIDELSFYCENGGNDCITQCEFCKNEEL